MKGLVLVRLLGMVIGVGLASWVFSRYRSHLIRRTEFLLLFLVSISLLIVSIYPDSINIIAGMMALRGEAYGRLIAILIISNMVLWLWFLHHRIVVANRERQFDILVRRIGSTSFETSHKGGVKPITVVIPAVNEADNLREILTKMPQKVRGIDLGVLVVDDGSIDGTPEVVTSMGFSLVKNPMNRGQGAALRLGFDVAIERGAKIIVTMDADGQHLPEEIETLVHPIIEDRCDFVIGSRVLGSREKESTVRLLGVYLFSRMINFLAGTNISDCSSGYRAFKVDAIREIHLVQDQYIAPEAIIDAAKKGLRLGEVPITILKRKHGESKKGRNLSYGFRFARTILKTWWR